MRTAVVGAEERDLTPLARLAVVIFLVLINLTPPAGVRWLTLNGDAAGLARLFAGEIGRHGMALLGACAAYVILSLGLPGLTAALNRVVKTVFLPLLAWTVAHLFL